MKKAMLLLLILPLVTMLLLPTAYGEDEADHDGQVAVEIPAVRVAMNDPQNIVLDMEILLEPIYEQYLDPERLKLPEGFAPGPNEVVSIDAFDWQFGALTLWMDETGAVNQVEADVRDHTTVNAVAAALFAASVQGASLEEGQIIADALHIGDMDFPANYDKYTYVLDHNGYYYIYSITNRFLRLTIFPNDIKPDYAASVFFDIDGNEIANPAAGTDGYDAEGDYATTTGDAHKDALVQSLLPPESTINQARSDAVDISSMTAYPDALAWYEGHLPKLGFVSALSEEEQALLSMDETSRVYSGTIDAQPVTILIQDWSDTYGGYDMSLILIMFTVHGSDL